MASNVTFSLILLLKGLVAYPARFREGAVPSPLDVVVIHKIKQHVCVGLKAIFNFPCGGHNGAKRIAHSLLIIVWKRLADKTVVRDWWVSRLTLSITNWQVDIWLRIDNVPWFLLTVANSIYGCLWLRE
jgi:hypothetical protein